MKIFEIGDKVNFVDHNNRFVGYDLGQCCCEYAGWFITDHKPTKLEEEDNKFDLDGYCFDKSGKFTPDISDLDEGVAICFELKKPDSPSLYLTLFNCHNGYYSHGFDEGTVDSKGKFQSEWRDYL